MSRIGRAARRGFTLVELLVVIALLVLLIGIAVPAFSAILYSSDQSLAENTLRTGLAAGRDAAMQSPGGEDGAAVFMQDAGGRVTIVPCAVAGRLDDLDNSNSPLVRDVFVPAAGIDAVQLPKFWTARGYMPPNSMGADLYERTYTNAEKQLGNWVAPETGYYDQDPSSAPDALASDGADRQTFMVRFEASTGFLDLANSDPSLVLSPSVMLGIRDPGAPPWSTYRVDRAVDARRYVQRVLSLPESDLDADGKRLLLGDESTDTVLAKPVSQIAISSERRLAGAVDVRLDRDTDSLYADPIKSGGDPAWSNPGLDPRKVNEWIENRLVRGGRAVPSDARLFTMQRYQGALREITVPEEVRQ